MNGSFRAGPVDGGEVAGLAAVVRRNLSFAWVNPLLFFVVFSLGAWSVVLRLAEERAALVQSASLDLQLMNLDARGLLMSGVLKVSAAWSGFVRETKLTADDFVMKSSGDSASEARLEKLRRSLVGNLPQAGVLPEVTLVNTQGRPFLGVIPEGVAANDLRDVFSDFQINGQHKIRVLPPVRQKGASCAAWVVVVIFADSEGHAFGGAIYRLAVPVKEYSRKLQCVSAERSCVMIVHPGETMRAGFRESGSAWSGPIPDPGEVIDFPALREALRPGTETGLFFLPASAGVSPKIGWFFRHGRDADGYAAIAMTDADSVLESWRRSRNLAIATGAVIFGLGCVVLFQSARRRRLKAAIAAMRTEVRERSLREERIRKNNQELEARVEERTRVLCTTTAELDARTRELAVLNRELEAYAVTISHDIRAPLRRIAGFSEIIRDDHSELLHGDTAKALESVLSESLMLTELVESLLNLARHSGDRCVRAPVDVARICREVVDVSTSRRPSVAVPIGISPTGMVEADARLLRIALGQLWEQLSRVALELPSTRVTFARDEDAPVPSFRFMVEFAGGVSPGVATIPLSEEDVGLRIAARIVSLHGGTLRLEYPCDAVIVCRFTLPPEADFPVAQGVS